MGYLLCNFLCTGLGFEHVSNLNWWMLDWNDRKFPINRGGARQMKVPLLLMKLLLLFIVTAI